MKGKGNDGTGNTQERDSWQTNQELWDLLDSQYKFTHDCCASRENTKCHDYSTEGTPLELNTHIEGISWMNPPFSKANKLFAEFFNIVESGVAIYRCDNIETKVWQEIIFKHASWVFIPKGRISYTPFDISIRGGMTRFPSALIGFNVEPLKVELEGTLLQISKKQRVEE